MEREEKEGGAFSARLVLSSASRRRLWILSAVLVFGMLLLGISSAFSDYKAGYENAYQDSYRDSYGNLYSEDAAGEDAANSSDSSDMSEEAALERRLVSILERIEGAGRVDVRLTFAVGGRTEYAVNSNISERQTGESEGDEQRSVTERTASETLVLPGNGGPVVVQQSGAKVQGVLVVADGGADAAVCARISAALQNLLAVPAHKIIICPAGG